MRKTQQERLNDEAVKDVLDFIADKGNNPEWMEYILERVVVEARKRVNAMPPKSVLTNNLRNAK